MLSLLLLLLPLCLAIGGTILGINTHNLAPPPGELAMIKAAGWFYHLKRDGGMEGVGWWGDGGMERWEITVGRFFYARSKLHAHPIRYRIKLTIGMIATCTHYIQHHRNTTATPPPQHHQGLDSSVRTCRGG